MFSHAIKLRFLFWMRGWEWELRHSRRKKTTTSCNARRACVSVPDEITVFSRSWARFCASLMRTAQSRTKDDNNGENTRLQGQNFVKYSKIALENVKIWRYFAWANGEEFYVKKSNKNRLDQNFPCKKVNKMVKISQIMHDWVNRVDSGPVWEVHHFHPQSLF